MAHKRQTFRRDGLAGGEVLENEIRDSAVILHENGALPIFPGIWPGHAHLRGITVVITHVQHGRASSLSSDWTRAQIVHATLDSFASPGAPSARVTIVLRITASASGLSMKTSSCSTRPTPGPRVTRRVVDFDERLDTAGSSWNAEFVQSGRSSARERLVSKIHRGEERRSRTL